MMRTAMVVARHPGECWLVWRVSRGCELGVVCCDAMRSAESRELPASLGVSNTNV
jgi:hypothetical protein